MRVDEIQNELGKCISKLDQIETKLFELQKDYGYSKFYRRESEVRLPNGNHKLYKCPAGFYTIGWGYNIEAHGLDDSDAERLLNSALSVAQSEVAKIISNWRDIDTVRRSVLIDMSYNMGISKLKKFKKMIAAIKKEDWKEAAAQMKDSAWFKQVGNRSKVLHKMMLSGEYPK